MVAQPAALSQRGIERFHTYHDSTVPRAAVRPRARVAHSPPMRAVLLPLVSLLALAACRDDPATLCAADGTGCACAADEDCAAGLHCYMDRCLPAGDGSSGGGSGPAPTTSAGTGDGTGGTTTTPTTTATTGGELTDHHICRDLEQTIEPGLFAGFEDTVELPPGGTIAAVRVELVARTADAAEVGVSIAGAQRFTGLFDGEHCKDGLDVAATFDAAAATALADACPEGQGLSGAVRPDGDLGVFVGRAPGGPWTLRIRDREFAQGETTLELERWCLHIDVAPGAANTDPTQGDALWLRPKSLGDAGRRILATWAYDESRDVVVGFGGCPFVGQAFSCQPTGAMKMTVEWDGVEWRDIDTAEHPGGFATGHHAGAMAFDPVAGHLVLFGGFPDSGGFAPTAATWTYDGAAWTELAPPQSPSPRAEHTAVWDPVHSQVIVFGGHDPSAPEPVKSDVWAWDGATWSPLPGAGGPGPLHLHAATWHAGLQRMLVFGGFAAGGYPQSDASAQLWSYDPAAGAWQQHADAPVGVAAPQIVHDALRDRVVLFGGRAGLLGDSFFETHEWDGAAWTTLLRPLWEPDARFGHGMLWLAPHDLAFMYGGFYNQANNDTWYYTPVP